jgi:predicted phosphodiesterase
MRLAVFGDIHGHWRDFRDKVLELQSQAPLDLVLQCGDAQAIRNENDLKYMHCPKKYRELVDFWMFHDGVEKFPVGMLIIKGTRIVGLSGVYSPKHFNTPHIDWPNPGDVNGRLGYKKGNGQEVVRFIG